MMKATDGEAANLPVITIDPKWREEVIALSHPAANLFLLGSDEELARIASGIAAVGQLFPIVKNTAGLILDGRNRWIACKAAGIEAKEVIEDIADDQVLQRVCEWNIVRRHVKPEQKVAMAVLAIDVAGLPKKLTQVEAAELFGVSERSVRDGAKTYKERPADFQLMLEGKVSTKAATDLGKLPEAQRNEARSHLAAGNKRQALDIIKEKRSPPTTKPSPQVTDGEKRPPVDSLPSNYAELTEALSILPGLLKDLPLTDKGKAILIEAFERAITQIKDSASKAVADHSNRDAKEIEADIAPVA